MHSLQLQSGDSEQVNNPWVSRSNNGDSSLSTATARNHLRGDTGSVFRDDALVSSGVTGHMSLSPSPPPQSAQPIHSQPPMQDIDTTQPDPRIASLKAIFPDFDDAVILDVLESADNDHDRALDVLLGMSDPSFVPPASTPPPSQPPNQFQSDPSFDSQRLSQEALDEQFARRLALEEQQAAAQAQALQDEPSYIMYQPYQIRRGGRNGWGGRSQGQPQTQGQGGKDTMTEFQEGFNRIAESGKKTFSSIVSKVKAKMHDFEQGQGWSGSQNPPPDQAPQPIAASSLGQQQDSGQGAYTQPSANLQRQTSESRPARTSTYMSSPPRSGILRRATTEPAQPSYYDPNTQGYDLYGDDEGIQITDKTTPSAAAPSVTTQNPATSPRTDSPPTPPPPSETSSLPSYASPVLPPSHARLSSINLPTRSLSPTITGAKGTMPGGVDFSKLGLLPKRPISLVQPQSPPVAGADAGVRAQRMSIADSESTLASPTVRESLPIPGADAGVRAQRVSIADSEITLASPTVREESEFVENPFEDQA